MKHILLALGASLLASGSALAFPPAGTPVLNPLNLSGNGLPASVIFAFSDAADSSNLIVPALGLIVNNQAAAPGDVTNVGSPVGPITFELANLDTGITFTNNIADAFGSYHFFASNNYNVFSVGAIDPAVQAAIDALPAGTNFVFVGTEDLDESDVNGTDYDYNDIIYVFTQFEVVPAPVSLALFGLGLIGLGYARRRA